MVMFCMKLVRKVHGPRRLFFFFKIALSDEVLENKGMVVIYFLTGN